jgi:mRNA (guanine-N7-)-methyltransferase
MSASMPSLMDEDPAARGQQPAKQESPANQFLPDLSDSSDSNSNDAPKAPKQRKVIEEPKTAPAEPPPPVAPAPSAESEGDDEPASAPPNAGVPGVAVETVASHYNAIENSGPEARTKTRIFFMRNFNNWVKSMQIGEYLKRIRSKGVTTVKVLDLGCGKGGDLLKWMRGNVSHVTCADVAAVSMEHCATR